MDRFRLHPSEEDLFLFADGELRKRQAARIERHLAACWQCRTLLAQAESAIYEFVTLRRKLLDQRLRGADFPSGYSSRALLQTRIAGAAASPCSGKWLRIRQALWTPVVAGRPLWTAGSLIALIAVLLLLQSLLTPSVSAMEVIANGQSAELRRPVGAVLHQRVRVERRESVGAVAAVDYDLWKSASRSRLLLEAGNSGPADRLRSFYQSRGVDRDAPLSVTSFAQLRDSLGPVHDEVRGRDQITVTSTPRTPGGEVKSLELTVRRSDWHAVAERIELRDAEYLLTELLNEAVAENRVDPAIFAVPPPPVVPPPDLRPLRRAAIPAPPPSGPTAAQLDDAEIQLREAFHQTGADVEEIPEIQREGDSIHFRLFTQSNSREQEILAALTRIPYLVPEINELPGGQPESSPAPTPSATLYATEPPLAKALRKYSGGLEPANNYLNSVRDSYLQVLVEASALQRLAARYTDAEWARLSAESQQRLDRIANDHIAAVRTNLRSYLRLVSPVLDEMERQQQVPPPGKRGEAGAGCASWRTAAQSVVQDLAALQTSFRRLFVEERTEQPLVLATDDLLSQALRSRAWLEQYLLCQ